MIACAKAIREHYPNATFSSVYKSAARDKEDQDDFLNAVVKIETDETLDDVYKTTKKIEEELGKDPPYEKGPRTIDLDILITSHESRVTSHELTIPHPRMHERRFVLEPLCELIDDEKWQGLLQNLLNQKCTKIELQL